MRPIHSCFAVLFAFACATTLAQPLADRIPSDAILYAGWAGTEKLQPGYDKSNLKGVLDHSSLPQLLNEIGPKIAKRLEETGEMRGEAKEVFAAFLAIGDTAWHKPTAIYLGPLDYSGKQPMPKIALFCDAGKDAADLSARVSALVAKIVPPEAPLKIRTQVWGNSLLVISTFEIGERLEESLSQRDQFKNALKQVQPDAAFTLFFDSEKVVNVVSMGINMAADDKTKTMWRNILVTTGVAGMRRIVYTSGFDGQNWTSNAFIEAPMRLGLLSTLLDSQPVSDDLLQHAPKSATWLAATRLDLAKTTTDARNALAKLEPNASRDVEEGLAQLNKLLGMDVQKDLLAALGDQWIVYNSPDTGQGLLGMVLVNPLRDPAKAQASLLSLQSKLNDVLPKGGDPVTISITSTKVGDLTIHSLAIPALAPCWAIKDGNLYVALYPQILAAAAERKPTPGDSILVNESFQAARKRLAVNNAISVSYMDLPALAPRGYQMILALQQTLTGFADMFGLQTPAMVVPPLNKITPHLTPSISSTWTDETGWHYKGTSPFPGADLLGGEQAVATAAAPVLTAVALPALAKARQQAVRAQGMSNLRQIGIATIMYAQDKQDQLPPDLGSLLPYINAPQVFVSPDRQHGAPPAKPEDVPAWINHNTDYVYVGAKLGKFSQIQATAQTILAHEKFELAKNGMISVLYADGHVESQPVDQVRTQLAQPDKPLQGL